MFNGTKEILTHSFNEALMKSIAKNTTAATHSFPAMINKYDCSLSES